MMLSVETTHHPSLLTESVVEVVQLVHVRIAPRVVIQRVQVDIEGCLVVIEAQFLDFFVVFVCYYFFDRDIFASGGLWTLIRLD